MIRKVAMTYKETPGDGYWKTLNPIHIMLIFISAIVNISLQEGGSR
jgi:hypothetical protein